VEQVTTSTGRTSGLADSIASHLSDPGFGGVSGDAGEGNAPLLEARHLRPSRLPISASVERSASASRSLPETWERRIRFSAIKYSHLKKQALVDQARHVRQQSCPAVVLHDKSTCSAGASPIAESMNLPPKERACVLLKDVFEYSLEEIAEFVESTVGGVKAALNRGRSKLDSLQDWPAAPRGMTPENKRIRRLYVERFNSRDWDGLRELISADARLLVADRYSGKFAAGGYLGVYSRMQVTWRLTPGEVDDEPSIILLNQRNGEWEIEGVIRIDIGADGRVEHIYDYQHCPWILTAGSIVVRGSID
jgi:hypothetical protein